MNDPFVIAVAIVVFSVVVCTIAGIVLAREFYPFVSTREVEIDVSDLDMFDQRIEVYEKLADWNRLRTRYIAEGNADMYILMNKYIADEISAMPETHQH
tara:strand:- start:1319 stop:1615 length:297 start_codon:yes stop_codon:yes gene_type:complete